MTNIYFQKICSDDQIEKNEMGRACSIFWESRGLYRVLVGKLEGKRQLGRSRRRWEDNIKVDLQEVRCDGSMWLRIGTDGGHL